MNKLLLCLFVCVAHVEANEDHTLSAEAADLLQPFHRAVQETIDPWQEGQTMPSVLTEVSKLANKHIIGQDKTALPKK